MPQRKCDAIGPEMKRTLEATPGIEPGCTDLQSVASPLRHVAIQPGVAEAKSECAV